MSEPSIEALSLSETIQKSYEATAMAIGELGRRMQDYYNSANDISTHPTQSTSSTHSTSTPVNTFVPLHNLPQQNRHYQPRESLMLEIEAKLAAHQVVVIAGPGGMGKTQLSKQLALTSLASRHITWLVQAQNPSSVEESYRTLALKLQLTLPEAAVDLKKLVNAVHLYLTNEPHLSDWMLVFDNVLTEDSFLEMIPNIPKRHTRGLGWCIITSRSPEWMKLPVNAIQKIDGYTKLEAVSYIQVRLPQFTASNAEALADLLKCHPLGLAQAVGYIFKRRKTFSQYESEYHASAKLLDVKIPAAVDEYDSTIFQTVMLTLTWLHENVTHQHESALAISLVNCMAMLAAEPLPKSVLLQLANRWMKSEHDDVEMALKLTEDFGLIVRLDMPSGGETTMYQMHELTAKILFDNLNHEEQTAYRANLFNLFATIFDEQQRPSREVYSSQEACFGHVHAFLTLLEKSKRTEDADVFTDNEMANLYEKVGSCERELARFESAIRSHKSCVEVRTKIFSPPHPLIAQALFCLASDYERMGDYGVALQVCEACHTMRLQLFDSISLEIGQVVTLWATLHYKIGEYHEALRLFREALHVYLTLKGKMSIEVGRCFNHLGNTLKALKQLDDAVKLYEKSLEIKREHFGENHTDVATVLFNIGNTYKQLQMYAEAVDFYQRSYMSFQSVYGEQHIKTAECLWNIGAVMNRLGHYELEIATYNQVMPVFINSYGERHVQIGVLYQNLGNAYESLEKNSEALQWYEKSLLVYDCCQGKDSKPSMQIQSYIDELRRGTSCE